MCDIDCMIKHMTSTVTWFDQGVHYNVHIRIGL